MVSLEDPGASIAENVVKNVPGIDIIIYSGKNDATFKKDYNQTAQNGFGPYPTIIHSASGRLVNSIYLSSDVARF